MTKVTDLEANLEQFKIEQAAINSEAAKQLALLQATIEKNKVEAHQQFAEIMNALKALQPPTPSEDTTQCSIWKKRMDEDFVVDLMLASEGKSIQRVSCDSPAGNKSVEKENIKSGITCMLFFKATQSVPKPGPGITRSMEVQPLIVLELDLEIKPAMEVHH
ncbi:hypothetical protein Tco_1089437 [Tanacetum coccineum]